MTTRRARSTSVNKAEALKETPSEVISEEKEEQEKEVVPEPELSDDLIVFQAVEKAKKIKEEEEKKPNVERGIVSDRDQNQLKKFNDRIVNKLGLSGTRSYRV